MELTRALEDWIANLEDEFAYELGNQAIQSAACKYANAGEARKAMILKAIHKGVSLVQPPDFDADVAKVQAVNAATP